MASCECGCGEEARRGNKCNNRRTPIDREQLSQAGKLGAAEKWRRYRELRST